MKKLLLAGTTVLLMAAPASAQSTSPAAAFFGGGGFGVIATPATSPAKRVKLSPAAARARAEYECKAYGFCGQQKRR
jgi:hypothetical protein